MRKTDCAVTQYLSLCFEGVCNNLPALRIHPLLMLSTWPMGRRNDSAYCRVAKENGVEIVFLSLNIQWFELGTLKWSEHKSKIPSCAMPYPRAKHSNYSMSQTGPPPWSNKALIYQKIRTLELIQQAELASGNSRKSNCLLAIYVQCDILVHQESSGKRFMGRFDDPVL